MGILEGRVAIVTGASGGIGGASAIRFAEEGASLIVSDINKEGLDSLVSEIKAKGGNAVAVTADLAKEEDIDEVVNTCIKEFGKVDILANIGQGGLGEHTHLSEATPELAMYSYQTGPLQSMLFMQKCFPYMKKAGYGRIINVSSASALVGAPGFSSYEMAKGAVMALTRNSAKEWGKYGIVTNCFLPVLKTPAYDMTEQGKAAAEAMKEQIPLGYFGTSYEDGSPIIAFLASEGASYLNGQFIGIDGGAYLIA